MKITQFPPRPYDWSNPRKVEQQADGRWRVQCCRECDGNGWRTDLDEYTAYRFARCAAFCDDCCELNAAVIRERNGGRMPEPMSEDELIRAERRQLGIY